MRSQNRAGLNRHKGNEGNNNNSIVFQRPFIIGKFSSNSSSVQDTYPRGETEAFYSLNINLLFFFSQLEPGTSVSYYFPKTEFPGLAKIVPDPSLKRLSRPTKAGGTLRLKPVWAFGKATGQGR